MISRNDLAHLFRNPGPIVHPQHPVAQPQYNSASIQATQRAEAERREKMRRIAKNPTDKNIPEGVEDVCIGDGVARYKELREVERTLDATMMRKKLDVMDSKHHSRASRYGTMRIWISNTAENQPWQSSGIDADAFDFESENNATDEDGAESKPAAKPKMFSHYFTSINIDFDRAKSLQPDNFTQIEWKRPENPTAKEANFSELEFERKGDENINITINLQRYQNPEVFRLSKPLAELLDTDEEDRAGILMGIWEYARSQHLQQEEDERKFACDARLKALFGGQDHFFFPNLPQLIKQHLTTLPPIQLQYTIRVDKDYISPPADSGRAPSEPTVYDVQVALEDPMQPLFQDILRRPDSIQTLQEIQKIDEQLVLLMGAIGQSKAKHAFFTSMSKDPVTFFKRWLSSQKRDLEVLLGEATRGGGEDVSGEEWRRGGADGVWGSEVAKESVALWLARSNIKPH
ncbi:SWIB-domain-containing protein implicated in chromatin remodeling [Pyrenophora tritici-repentis]|uniref:SWIB-domain-containing protein implicated in chromatin remodeling n=1 Tax=Pyrenophora tritici-repentis TaxID=45151 RepID=A0A317BIQ6_9PLEO|nr:swi-snf complex protein [Pyrenophora tritici-repentis]KAF7577648.1 SWIB-domain-containing protein implicated in chromatin remodeling [Pyrenophora tritici-repentis]KAG9388271.1 swi-snf complex protein [Pyrenophora tritici-repentis]KAI0584137.1 swi-snf complex subunit protein [Pyrenophora tritici-repentis]KAI0609309.1 swi-snf complex subunit protein [Pyrenophora tritici-repentis]